MKVNYRYYCIQSNRELIAQLWINRFIDPTKSF